MHIADRSFPAMAQDMRLIERNVLGFATGSFRVVFPIVLLLFASIRASVLAAYTGTVSTVSAHASVQAAGLEILGNGGGAGTFQYKGSGNAVDAAVAAALVACVVNPGNASLGGYGGHMLIWKSGWDGEPKLVTCIDFNAAAGS